MTTTRRTEAAQQLINPIREALAKADGFELADLDPDDYQDQTASILRAIADHCDKAGGAYASRGLNDQAGAAFHLMENFQDAANLAEYIGTPCDFVACEPGGEPCSTHEQLMSHADGDHELCDHKPVPECTCLDGPEDDEGELLHASYCVAATPAA